MFAADVLKGKVALITGGGGGIGLEIATAYARDKEMIPALAAPACAAPGQPLRPSIVAMLMMQPPSRAAFRCL